ncbi:MAG: hypothetical protein WAL56_11070 [Candidatus Sulfotelmatobacter sp.]
MPRSTARSRTSALLSKALQSELSAYVIAAGAAGAGLLAAAQPAAAQIVYTPVHSELNHDGAIRIDLNHDGLADLVIREIPSQNNGFSGNLLQAVPKSGGIKLGNATECAAAMPAGSVIGTHDRFFDGAAVMLNLYYVYYFGSWTSFGPGLTRYLGIRFQIKGETHYGWARMTVKVGYFEYVDALLTGYAYETQPNKPIHAGDTGNSETDAGPTNETSLLNSGFSGTLGALALGVKAVPILRSAE